MEMQILFFLMSCHLLGLTEADIFTFKTLKKGGGTEVLPSREGEDKMGQNNSSSSCFLIY